MANSRITNNELFNLMEERRVETAEELKILHKRITESNEKIADEIAELKEHTIRHQNEEKSCLWRIENRLGELEKMKWIIIGGGATVGFLLLGGLEAIKSFLS